MSMKSVKVKFETITPIFTGDAWGSNSEIKASSVMGALRAYCKKNKIPLSKLNEGFDYNHFRDNIKTKSIKEILKEQKISLESQLFGCTGWKSRVIIESIDFQKNGDKYNINFITFKIDKKFIDEFNKYLQCISEIYIGKGQKKEKGGKIKIVSLDWGSR